MATIRIRDHKLMIRGGILKIETGMTKQPTIQEWVEAGLDLKQKSNPKICFRRGRSGVYEYTKKDNYFRISMAGKPSGKAPLWVAVKMMNMWLEDNGPTGLITDSRRVCG